MFNLAAPTSTAPPCIPSLYTSYLSEYNVIAFSSLTVRSNVGYKTVTCGQFSSPSSTLGSELPQTFSPLEYSLEINGSTVSGNPINIQKGSVGVGPSPANRITKISNTQYKIDNNFMVNLNQGNGANVTVNQALPTKCASMISNLKDLSTTLSQLSPNNFVDFPTSQPGPVYLNVTNVDTYGVAVFNFSLSSIFSDKVQSIALIPTNSQVQLVVINVYGSAATWQQGSLNGNWFGSTYGIAHTIWNFYQATSLTFQVSMKGTVLAPSATLTVRSQMNGAVAANILNAEAAIFSPLAIFPNCTSVSTTTAGTSQSFLELSIFICILIRVGLSSTSIQPSSSSTSASISTGTTQVTSASTSPSTGTSITTEYTGPSTTGKKLFFKKQFEKPLLHFNRC